MFRKISNLSVQQTADQLKNTKELLDLIANYFNGMRYGPVKPSKNPIPIPKSLPIDPIAFPKILEVIETSVFPNNLHWQHPMFYAFFPSNISWESIQGSILAKALGSVSFTKFSCPIANEIEICVADWMAEMLKLPEQFFHSKGPGGGLTYGSASEAVLTAMICSKFRKPGAKHVMYTSDQSHFSVEKAARLLGGIYRMIPGVYDPKVDNYPMSIEFLKAQIEKDIKEGLTPTFICGALGTTNIGANDDVKAIGEIAKHYDMWFHIDSAYAGSLFVLPELRHNLDGVELCTTVNMNTSKLMLTGFDSSLMWVKDVKLFTRCLSQEGSYIGNSGNLDFKNWQLPLGRDCKGLKLWLVIQQFGVSGIQQAMRRHVEAGKLMEKLLRDDGRFEIVVRREYGLVCFRVKGDNSNTDKVLQRLAENEYILLLGSKLNGKTIIRFSPAVCLDDLSNITEAFNIVKSYLD